MTIDRTLKILLVEDSAFVRRSQKKALNKLGFQNVIETENGADAIHILEEEKDIRLIVSDWVMPILDGYELLLWVRSDETYQDVPFIMATARGEKKHTTRAVEAGVTDFITKPFGAGELDAVITAIFGAEESSTVADVPEVPRPRKTATGKTLIRAAHIQITDHLSLGVLKHLLATGELDTQHFELETVCMPSWNPVQQALEQGKVDAAFILAPIAMDLFNFGVPIKLLLLAHKNGSTFVRKKATEEDGEKSLHQFFKDKTFYIPHELSVHHMLSHIFLRGIGLNPGFKGAEDTNTYFEVMPPIQMTELLITNPQASGFSVAEPLGTQSIAEGIAELLFLSGELWENHPCCVVAVRDELIEQHPEAVQEFTRTLVQAGQFISQKPETAAGIGVSFLDPDQNLALKESVLKNVLKEEQGIQTGNMFPVIEDFERMQRYMVEEMHIGSLIDLESFIDTRFAQVACPDTSPRSSTLHDVSDIVARLASEKTALRTSKAKLNLEGKYLIFALESGEYGFNVMDITEIIEMKPIRSIPQSPPFIKGVTDFRGAIVPVLDLGLKLGILTKEQDDRARIVVLDIQGESTALRVGVIVDSVSEIVDVKAEDIEDAPRLVTSVEADYILGMAKINGSPKILLSPKQLLTQVDQQEHQVPRTARTQTAKLANS